MSPLPAPEETADLAFEAICPTLLLATFDLTLPNVFELPIEEVKDLPTFPRPDNPALVIVLAGVAIAPTATPPNANPAVAAPMALPITALTEPL